MKQIQRHLGTVTALVLLSILAAATIFSFTALKHKPQTAERTFQSVLPTPTTRVVATATPNRPKKDIVVTVVPPEIAPDVLTEPTIITKRSAPRSELAVDGNYVIWRSYEDRQTNVIAYNIQTGEERRISSLPGGKSNLKISGNYVVWEDVVTTTDRVIPVVRIFDLMVGKELAIGPEDRASMHPDISDKIVVWNDGRNSQDGWVADIYGNDLQKGKEIPILVGSGRHLFPRVSGDWVIYLDWLPGVDPGTPSSDQPTLHAHSIRTGEDINLGPVAYRNDAWSYKRHVISGHVVAWQGRDGATHLYDLAARRERVLAELHSYDDLVLNGRFFTVGSQLYNVETGAKLVPLRAAQPVAFGPAAQVDAVTTDGQTLVWGFDLGNEGRVYVARFRRLP